MIIIAFSFRNVVKIIQIRLEWIYLPLIIKWKIITIPKGKTPLQPWTGSGWAFKSSKFNQSKIWTPTLNQKIELLSKTSKIPSNPTRTNPPSSPSPKSFPASKSQTVKLTQKIDSQLSLHPKFNPHPTKVFPTKLIKENNQIYKQIRRWLWLPIPWEKKSEFPLRKTFLIIKQRKRSSSKTYHTRNKNQLPKVWQLNSIRRLHLKPCIRQRSCIMSATTHNMNFWINFILSLRSAKNKVSKNSNSC